MTPTSPRKRQVAHHSLTRKAPERLLPLHLSLAWLVVCAFPSESSDQPGVASRIFSTTFQASILRVIAVEIYEVNDSPATYESLKTETDVLIRHEVRGIKRRNDKVRARGQLVAMDYEAAEHTESWMTILATEFADPANGCVCLDSIERELKNRISEDADDLPPDMLEPLERRSPLGLFFRSLLLSLRKLSFDETASLSKQISRWCGHNDNGPSRPIPGPSSGLGASEEAHDRRSKALQDLQIATSSGDYAAALTSMRRFYDYQFPYTSHGQRQHALLNLAAFHFTTGGLEAASSTVKEAIRIARSEGDSVCLQQCMSLMQRLNTETDVAVLASSRPRVKQGLLDDRLPKPALPEDDLWLLKSALDLGEPVHVAFRRVYHALARLDCFGYDEKDKDKDKEREREREKEKEKERLHSVDLAPWHATQAALWDLIGSDTLTEVHQDYAMDDSNDVRLTILFSRAEKMASRGKVDDALALLLNYEAIHGMNIVEYQRWTEVIWSILERQASLTDDDELRGIIASSRGPRSKRIGPGGPPRDVSQLDFTESQPYILAQDLIRDELRVSRKMLDADAPPHLVLMHVLSAAQLSKELGTWRLYRVAVVSIAEVLLAMVTGGGTSTSNGGGSEVGKRNGTAMAERAIEQVESVWSQIGSEDEETVARAALVLARGKVSLALDLEHSDPETARRFLDEAFEHVQQSIQAAEKVGSKKVFKHAVEVGAVVAEAKGDEKGVEGMMKMWDKVMGEVGGGGEGGARREKARKVAQVVALVGARIAEGWQ